VNPSTIDRDVAAANAALSLSGREAAKAAEQAAAKAASQQVSQRWAGHPVDPTLSWPQVDCLDGSLHGACAGSGFKDFWKD
jgi:hypothetical protein